MPNRLANETSPYLLQHAHNPVDWFPWGPDALARAKLLDKPIFLSVGYAACHWCHVMERESFENEETARFLNDRFVPIKVDREERPEIDQIYMAAVQAMTGQGGWPMSVFLTPEGRPFYGGTYFPDEPRHGMPSFRQVLAGIDGAWRGQRADLEAAGAKLVDALVQQQRLPSTTTEPSQALLETAVAAIEAQFDDLNGGWGRAPKFPQPMTIEFLLRRHLASGDQRPLAIARRSLDRMANGGIHDQLGGGFHRYSTDEKWLVPHFEQMLYDNAQLVRVYVHAFRLTDDPRYRDVATGTLDYMARELATEDGAFAASQDADTEGEEGATFTWSAVEIREALGDDAPLFTAAYGVTDDGNWEGRTILSRVSPPGDEATETRLARAREVLLERRGRRPQPARDDKALAAWNGLAIAAFAEASRQPGGERYREIAVRAATAILAGLRSEKGRLKRSWKDGRATGEGVLEDYSHLAEGLLALYEATFDERWFTAARELADVILSHFADPAGGFFDTADDHERLVTRPKDVQDNAVPAGGSMAALVLLRLAALTGEGSYRTAAERAIAQVAGFVGNYPTGFGNWLTAIDFALASVAEVAIVGDPGDAGVRRLLEPVFGGFRPNQVVAVGDPATSIVPLLGGRFAIRGEPTAYVCRNFACRQPVTEPEALAAMLHEAQEGSGG
ncbi:MAG: thioredoxin domain-containing protein [Chloroflexota bacterium]|nr:thioredoxin domain-containing protein [Chloroflexota bacterium]